MALLLSATVTAYQGPAFSLHHASRSGVVQMETTEDLKVLAKELNPVLGFWDPLQLSGMNIYGMGEEATVGWLRHAEIKHGRVAMAAFVGYCVQANGIHFPWSISSTVSYADIAAIGSPAAQWDAVPTAGKLQILGTIGLLEWFGESSYALEQSGEKHYMKGGKPGFYPSLKTAGIPHPVPFDLYNPFGLQSGMSEEKKAAALKAEINNGRLAMLGIMGFMSASKGLYVPIMMSPSITAPYSGEVMAPFAASDVTLPLVADMLKWPFF